MRSSAKRLRLSSNDLPYLLPPRRHRPGHVPPVLVVLVLPTGPEDSMIRRAVRLTQQQFNRLGSPREWGLPTYKGPGKMYHSLQRAPTITMALPLGRLRLRWEHRPLIIDDATPWAPATWRRAARAYERTWPGQFQIKEWL